MSPLLAPVQGAIAPIFADLCRLRECVVTSDVQAIRQIVSSSGFFSDEETEVAVELVEDCMIHGDRSDYRFVLAELGDGPVGFASYGPIECTAGSFDLYWIAVHNDFRRSRIGRRLLNEVERLIRDEGGRRIYIETSSRPLYAPTCAFYERCGYKLEARLEDFYAPDDGKLIYVKAV